jgi:hypothetical protein
VTCHAELRGTAQRLAARDPVLDAAVERDPRHGLGIRLVAERRLAVGELVVPGSDPLVPRQRPQGGFVEVFLSP